MAVAVGQFRSVESRIERTGCDTVPAEDVIGGLHGMQASLIRAGYHLNRSILTVPDSRLTTYLLEYPVSNVKYRYAFHHYSHASTSRILTVHSSHLYTMTTRATRDPFDPRIISPE